MSLLKARVYLPAHYNNAHWLHPQRSRICQNYLLHTTIIHQAALAPGIFMWQNYAFIFYFFLQLPLIVSLSLSPHLYSLLVIHSKTMANVIHIHCSFTYHVRYILYLSSWKKEENSFSKQLQYNTDRSTPTVFCSYKAKRRKEYTVQKIKVITNGTNEMGL